MFIFLFEIIFRFILAFSQSRFKMRICPLYRPHFSIYLIGESYYFSTTLLWIVAYIFVCLRRNKQNVKKKRNETRFYHRRTTSSDAKNPQELTEVEIPSPQGSDIPFTNRSDSGKIYCATFRELSRFDTCMKYEASCAKHANIHQISSYLLLHLNRFASMEGK
jgi:hypothetical protein